MQSVLNIRKFNKHVQINQFREPVNKTDWRIRSSKTTRVDAYYYPPDNGVSEYSALNQWILVFFLLDLYFEFPAVLPAGILQDRFFSADR